MVEHLSQTKVAQQSVTQIISLTFTNLVTPKAGGKNERLSIVVCLQSPRGLWFVQQTVLCTLIHAHYMHVRDILKPGTLNRYSLDIYD